MPDSLGTQNTNWPLFLNRKLALVMGWFPLGMGMLAKQSESLVGCDCGGHAPYDCGKSVTVASTQTRKLRMVGMWLCFWIITHLTPEARNSMSVGEELWTRISINILEHIDPVWYLCALVVRIYGHCGFTLRSWLTLAQRSAEPVNTGHCLCLFTK